MKLDQMLQQWVIEDFIVRDGTAAEAFCVNGESAHDRMVEAYRLLEAVARRGPKHYTLRCDVWFSKPIPDSPRERCRTTVLELGQRLSKAIADQTPYRPELEKADKDYDDLITHIKKFLGAGRDESI